MTHQNYSGTQWNTIELNITNSVGTKEKRKDEKAASIQRRVLDVHQEDWRTIPEESA